jgi:hypothetical protein
MLKQFAPRARMPPSPKKSGLDQKRHAHHEHRRPRAEQQRQQRAADCVPGRAARKRHIEHHREEGKRRAGAEQRQLLRRQLLLHLMCRNRPDREHGCGKDSAGRGAQVIFGNMHSIASRKSTVLNLFPVYHPWPPCVSPYGGYDFRSARKIFRPGRRNRQKTKGFWRGNHAKAESTGTRNRRQTTDGNRRRIRAA